VNTFQDKQCAHCLEDDSVHKLTEREYDFINDLVDNYSDKLLIDKQAAWLNAITQKVEFG